LAFQVILENAGTKPGSGRWYVSSAPRDGLEALPLFSKMETIMTNRNPQDPKMQDPKHVQGQKPKEDQREKQHQAENPDRNKQQGGFDPNKDRQQGSPDPIRQPDQSR